MKITPKVSTVNTTAKKLRSIDWIVVHYTAGTTSKDGSALSTAQYFAKASTKASSDFIVDDGGIIQYNGDIPNRYTWHCGGSKYNTKGGKYYKVCANANSIGVEICSNNRTGAMTVPNDSNYYFTDKTLSNAIELIRMLMELYNIHRSHVIRHYDVNGKPCPGVVGWTDETNSNTWGMFWDLL